MDFIIFIINIPWVSWIPRVSFDTVQFTGRVQVVPMAGTVCHGTGTVWENLTCGLPVLNPSGRVQDNTGSCSMLQVISIEMSEGVKVLINLHFPPWLIIDAFCFTL